MNDPIVPYSLETGLLTTAELGQRLGLSEREANELLARRGMQRINEYGEWELTEDGRKYGIRVPIM